MEILERFRKASCLRCLTRLPSGISQQIATDILIIEDEPLIAMDIEHMVESLGHRVVGIARTRNEALEDLFCHPAEV